MRLIDADKIVNYQVTADDGKRYVLLPVEKLSDIPTAYDVDAVLHELSLNTEDCTTTHTIFNTHIYVRFSKAVNIIKRGGKK